LRCHPTHSHSQAAAKASFRPSINVPKAILAQYVASFLTGFCYLITIFYAISDLDAILATDTVFPLSLIYHQATGSDAATVGLLVVSFIPTFIGAIGGFTIVGRTFWALSRDNATPFSRHFSTINPKTKNPFNAILLSGVLVTLLGCIYIGSARAFNDIAGSFVILTSLSYLAAILPHLLSGRIHMKPNHFWMKGIIGYIVNAVSCAYLIAFIVIFCFPFSLPVTPQNMNYSSLIVSGLTLCVAVFWTWKRGEYSGPLCGMEKRETDECS
jgi:choline transport protein